MEIIKGFEDYEIKFDGTITRLADGFKPTLTKGAGGYLQVKLVKNGKQYSRRIHNLLGQHFIANPHNKRMVDHIDGDTLNNNLQNLRWATHVQNGCNQVKAKGYCWRKRQQKWQAQIRINGRLQHLGSFATSAEASVAYQAAKVARDEKVWNDFCSKLII